MVTERKRRSKLLRVKTIKLPTSKQTRATSLNHSFVFFPKTRCGTKRPGSVTDPPLLDDSSRCVRRSPFPATWTDIYGLLQPPPPDQSGVNQTAAEQNQSEFLSAPTGPRVKPQQRKKKRKKKKASMCWDMFTDMFSACRKPTPTAQMKLHIKVHWTILNKNQQNQSFWMSKLIAVSHFPFSCRKTKLWPVNLICRSFAASVNCDFYQHL